MIDKDKKDPFQIALNISSYDYIEESRKILVNNLFCMLGAGFLFFFSVRAFTKDLRGLAVFTVCSGFLAVAIFVYQRATKNYEKAGYGVVTICVSLVMYLFVTGGVNNTGPLWCYVLSTLIIFVLGEKKGSVVNGFLIFYMAIAFIFDDLPFLATQYPADFELRFLATYLATFIMAVVYERSHTTSKQAMVEVGEQLLLMSRIDSLTGLCNRRAMRDLMQYEALRSKRINKPYSVLFMDIDFFKGINDKYGHDCGDLVLRRFAETVKATLRSTDSFSRWGGEEFIALLPETPSQYLLDIGEKIRLAVENMEFDYMNQKVLIRVSIGAATYDGKDDIDVTINNADKKLYQAKQEGRNRVVV